MLPIYQDTESCGFYGPTILIQYALGEQEPQLHNVWTEPVGRTLELIERIMNHPGGIVGFNQSHDQYHYNRTYGVLSMLPKSDPPRIIDYYDCEQEIIDGYSESRDKYCVKPVKCLDLMLYGRKGEFQATLNQKDIRIKKVPKELAVVLVRELSKRVDIPPIYFSKSKKGYNWEIVQLHEETRKEITPEEMSKFNRGEIKLHIDERFVNIRLKFNPTTAMKAIVENVLGFVDVDTISEMQELPKPEEFGWWPWYGDGWMKVIRAHIYAWTHNQRRLEYARNDVVYTRAIHEYFGFPELGDDDSELACAVGAMYWRGFKVDLDGCRSTYSGTSAEFEKIKSKVNVNAPKQVLRYLHEVCDPIEKVVLQDTKGSTLDAIADNGDWHESNPELIKRIQEVIKGRQLDKEVDLMKKLLTVGRLHVNFKVVGTKSNRMSGGSESYLSRGGSINPQGIKKGSHIRGLLQLASNDMVLCGGDFDSFEIAIAEARYKDPNLREQLLKGLKFHGIMGAVYYGMTYDEIVATSEFNKEDPEGYYARAKTADFAWFYGAMIPKLSEALRLTEEETEEAFRKIEDMFPKIKEARELNFLNYAALRQPEKGGAIAWHEPKKYVESFLGFRRYFTLEYNIIKSLYDLAQEVYNGTASDELKEIGKNVKVVRTDRMQTGTGALCSALYGAAFGIQGQVQRSAGNHEIQSPGGQLTKGLQRRIWDFQPSGCKPWKVMPMNCHDEVQCPMVPELIECAKSAVTEVVKNYEKHVPLIAMEWETNFKAWGKK